MSRVDIIGVSRGRESRLARAAAAGDGQAFAQLYDAYERRIYNFCLRIVGRPEDAADATQDAFVKVLQRLPKLEDRELDFGAYLYTSARHASYDVISRRKRADPVDQIPEHGAKPVVGDDLAPLDEDPERAALLDAQRDAVQAANARLPERQREVLALRELDDLSYDEIAEIMAMNRNSVAQLISRARIKLRDELRQGALGSVAVATAECERALPLLASRQDGQQSEGVDVAWLDQHLAGCPSCRTAQGAMEEAGVSYRAWAPVVPMVWLWHETRAKAASAVGADWSAIERPLTGALSGSAGGAAVVAGVTASSSATGADAAGTAAGEAAAHHRASVLVGKTLIAGALLALALPLPVREATWSPSTTFVSQASAQPIAGTVPGEPAGDGPAQEHRGRHRPKQQRPTGFGLPALPGATAALRAPAAPTTLVSVRPTAGSSSGTRPRRSGSGLSSGSSSSPPRRPRPTPARPVPTTTPKPADPTPAATTPVPETPATPTVPTTTPTTPTTTPTTPTRPTRPTTTPTTPPASVPILDLPNGGGSTTPPVTPPSGGGIGATPPR